LKVIHGHIAVVASIDDAYRRFGGASTTPGAVFNFGKTRVATGAAMVIEGPKAVLLEALVRGAVTVVVFEVARFNVGVLSVTNPPINPLTKVHTGTSTHIFSGDFAG